MRTNFLFECLRLTKPGIVLGNAISAIAGFCIGSQYLGFDFHTFFYMLFGLSFIVASGCVLNNYIDRDIDAKMERTKDRPLVTGTIPLHDALALGILLAILGAALLYLTDLLATEIALFGLFVYVVVYSLWCKRNTMHATVIGAVAGAVPPVVGYAAASHLFDLAAMLLFLILFTWQMPHAVAIAIRRIDDYRAAGIPVMPVALGTMPAKAQMLTYSVAFFIASTALAVTGFAGTVYLAGMAVLGAIWFLLCLQGFWAQDEKKWASRVFLFSLVIMLAFCGLCAVNLVQA